MPGPGQERTGPLSKRARWFAGAARAAPPRPSPLDRRRDTSPQPLDRRRDGAARPLDRRREAPARRGLTPG
ncbi:hypothetical protein, partial [Streptomyces sp. NPDC060187]|uniref:hypothetical protein n=1 Tax=Streptomyces sp. NPDC060187 TaxID=3347067 RepID=UPI00364E86C7